MKLPIHAKIKYTIYSSFLFWSLLSVNEFAQSYKILESSSDHIIVQFNFSEGFSLRDTLIHGKSYQYVRGNNYSLRKAGDPWLPSYYINLAAPPNSSPVVSVIKDEKIRYSNKFILPFPKYDPADTSLNINAINENIYDNNTYFPSKASEIIDSYIYRYSHLIILNASPYQYNPVTRELVFNKKLRVRIDYSKPGNKAAVIGSAIRDEKTIQFLKNNVPNYAAANQWGINDSQPVKTFSSSGYWYNPSKNYFKIYVHTKGIYRLTYNQLILAGVPLNNISLDKLELYNNGTAVPIYVEDKNSDKIFDSGDYFEFVGYPAKASPYAYSNIYNVDNVYFFSYQADSVGLRYKSVDGFPKSWDKTYQTNYTKLHFEKDSLYENLGYAGNDRRDFWLWDRVSGQNGSPMHMFEGRFDSFKNFNPDSTDVMLRVKMQGLTNSNACANEHNAIISLTGQPVGNVRWDGQNDITYQRMLTVSSSGIKIYPTGNLLQVKVTGDACPITKSDEILVDWFELEYWGDNRADTTNFNFSSPPNGTGVIRYWTWNWNEDSIKVFMPQKGEVIKNAQVINDSYHSILFTDTLNSTTDYFCAGEDYFLTPDSISQAVHSDLRNTSNGADYIIIANPKFKSVAERLANFRESNFPDSSITNPRIKIVYTNQIYNEFSYGLLDPYALQYFVKYAFDNWQRPAPAYVVLIGDMSHDYRHLLSSSDPNYVPSIPYYTYDYGEGFSDNEIVCVSGNDVHPDLAIGRLSCQTVEVGNVLVDKLIHYPADNNKEWKNTVLLISAGLNEDDENRLGLNIASVQLEESYLKPHGIHTTKIMRYPNEPEYLKYQGDGPAIRKAIDKGAAIVNYYGHGGGYQWDLVFHNDDIYMLTNGGRLPLILSVTCYTAHFDNQNVFGEQFNEVPGKGSIGFFGNSGLTYWNVGKNIDNLIFDEFFNERNYITGNVFMNAKVRLPAIGYNTSQIALLTYLGDPLLKLALPDKPDFQINSNDIIPQADNVVVNDSVQLKVRVGNLGVNFPGDTVSVQIFIQSSDTSYQLPVKKLPSFSIQDSVYFWWKPNLAGLYTITAKVNETNIIPEIDHSDNYASTDFPVYNINEPNIISPIDGYSTNIRKVNFKISDIGYYISHTLTYYIQVDTSLNFASPIKSQALQGSDGLVKWQSPELSDGIYFWRTRIYNGVDSSKWSDPRTFSISGTKRNGYYALGSQLHMFNTYNMNYTDSGLVLNNNYLPPKPSTKTFLGDIVPATSVLDSINMTALTTDGTYLYFGQIRYYALRNNKNGYTKIYKIGTGYNGTVKGKYYGALPNFYAPVRISIFYFPKDGFLYVSTEDNHSLLKVDRNTGDTTRIQIPPGLLRWSDSRSMPGDFYLNADSNFVYNLAVIDSLGNYVYTLRTFEPSQNWKLAKPDRKLNGTSYKGFTSFFVA